MDGKHHSQFPSHTPYLDITVLSAEALSISNRLIKKNAFVTALIDSQSGATTSADQDGGGYPTWNEKLQLPLPAGARSITIQVQCKTSFGPRMVGMAEIPMSDIVQGYVPAHLVHFLSYRLLQQDGGRNGIINLSVKVVGLENVRGQLPPMQKKKVCGQQSTPMRKNHVGGSLPWPATSNGAIVVGIPMGYGHGV